MAHLWLVEANSRGPDFPEEYWQPLPHEVMGKFPVCRTRKRARVLAKKFQEENMYNRPMLFPGGMVTRLSVKYRVRKYTRE